jgi:hypothetical protein
LPGLDLIQRLLNGSDVDVQILGLESLSHRKVYADNHRMVQWRRLAGRPCKDRPGP